MRKKNWKLKFIKKKDKKWIIIGILNKKRLLKKVEKKLFDPDACQAHEKKF